MSAEADALTRGEISAFEREDLADRRQQRELRRSFAPRIYWLLHFWLAAVVGLVTLDGFGAWGFDLTDPVLIALLGASTAKVIGIFYVVVRHIFPGGSMAAQQKLADLGVDETDIRNAVAWARREC